MEETRMVVLETAQKEDMREFIEKLQEAFAVAVVENFGPMEGGPIPADEDIWQSVNAQGAAVYHVLYEGKRVGGVVVSIHPDTNHNSLEFFFISPKYHSRGLGLAAWRAVEERYPDTLVWETVTPYFEIRNIHFYVNKCGFHIVEFYNPGHKDPHMPMGEEEMPGGELFFRFEKEMGILQNR